MSNMIINPSDLRLWGRNPRYTIYQDVVFSEIGKEDFKRDAFGNFKDIYNENVISYYKNLIQNKKQIESMVNLLENLLEGYNPNIDEILISTSPYLDKNKIYSGNTKFFYVLEGNRRIFAINLLLNTNKCRQIILDNSKEYSKIVRQLKDIFDYYDQNDISFDEIEVKFIDISQMQDDEIWRTLNTRHFGNRKGKLNWPRGLVLYSIYQRVKKIRKSLKLYDDDKMSDDDYNKTVKNIENFTGKKIDDRDLKMSLWVNYSIFIYNSQKNLKDEDKINILNTNEDGEEKKDNVIDSEEDDSENNDYFYVSSLELAMSSIKLLDDGIYKTLSKIINLAINTKTWKIDSSIEKKVFDSLIIYIINLIKKKKLNTRKFDENYQKEIMDLISLKTSDSDKIQKIISKDINKIEPHNVPLSILMEKNYIHKINFDGFSPKKRAEFIKNCELIKMNVIPKLDEILQLERKYKDIINLIKNKYKYSLVYIWLIELNSLLKNRAVNTIVDLPLIVFASSLRSSGELIMTWMLTNDKIFNNLEYNAIVQFAKYDSSFINLVNHIATERDKWKGFIRNIDRSLCHKCNSKKMFTTAFINKYNKKKQTFKDLKSAINILLNEINDKKKNALDSNALDVISIKIFNFLEWSSNLEEDGGFLDKLNSLMHSPQILLDIHSNIEAKQNYTKVLNSKIDDVLKLVEFILT